MQLRQDLCAKDKCIKIFGKIVKGIRKLNKIKALQPEGHLRRRDFSYEKLQGTNKHSFGIGYLVRVD